MTLHVNKNDLAYWQDYFGPDVAIDIGNAVREVSSIEVGDSLNVYVIFELHTMTPTSFSIQHGEPQLGGNSYIYVIAK